VGRTRDLDAGFHFYQQQQCSKVAADGRLLISKVTETYCTEGTYPSDAISNGTALVIGQSKANAKMFRALSNHRTFGVIIANYSR
jgi:hypothetical protein